MSSRQSSTYRRYTHRNHIKTKSDRRQRYTLFAFLFIQLPLNIVYLWRPRFWQNIKHKTMLAVYCDFSIQHIFREPSKSNRLVFFCVYASVYVENKIHNFFSPARLKHDPVLLLRPLFLPSPCPLQLHNTIQSRYNVFFTRTSGAFFIVKAPSLFHTGSLLTYTCKSEYTKKKTFRLETRRSSRSLFITQSQAFIFSVERNGMRSGFYRGRKSSEIA